MMVRLLLVVLASVAVIADPDGRQDPVDDDYNDRIVGGVRASIEEFPFLIEKKCGGTIITERWVLTAAHCLQADCFRCLTQVLVRGGSNYENREGVGRYGKNLITANFPPHDIALIEVNDVWPLNGVTLSLARLPREGDRTPAGRLATIMGWGGIDVKGTLPGMLMKQKVVILSNSECSFEYERTSVFITDMEICTLFDPIGRVSHTWQGDSGGPVVVNGEVVGIVSSGIVEGDTVLPDIHTRVSSYIDWIEEVIGPLPSNLP